MNYDFEKLVDAAMNYKPPIEMIASQIEMQKEGELYRAVQRVGFNVDKEELKKALMYDRNQYEEGFKDGLNACKWIPCSERLPESENKYGWVSCIVSVIRTHYPTSSYDICDSPYDENLVMHANYHVPQKIWHLECDEQLNALMDIEDAPLNGDYVIAWQPLPEPYRPKGEQ